MDPQVSGVEDFTYCMHDIVLGGCLLSCLCTRSNQSLLPVDRSISELVKQILPLLSGYVYLDHFVDMNSTYGAGLILNAFAAAIRVILNVSRQLLAPEVTSFTYLPRF